jgi:hypothetical protein
LEKFENYLEKVCDTIAHHQGRNKAARIHAEIVKKWEELENSDDLIKANCLENDNITDYIQMYEEVQKRYETVSNELEQQLDQLNDQSTRSEASSSTKIKLKPLEIAKFDGNCKMWNTFYETFTDTVIKGNCSAIEKMHYLNNSLEGDAKKVINHLSISNESYEDAIKILKNRFENKRKTTVAFIDAILEIPQIQSRSAAALIGLHDVVLESLLNLEKLDYAMSRHGNLC